MSRLVAFVLLLLTPMIGSAEAIKVEQKVVLCGDSRIVGVANEDGVDVVDRKAVGYNTDGTIYYLAEVGKGYDWLLSNLPSLEKVCDKNTVVYVALGVNDLYNLENYLELYDSLSKKLNGVKVVIAEVGGVDERKERDYGYSIKQSDINHFNDELKASDGKYKVVDFWYGDESDKTVDGIHYSSQEYEDTLKTLKEDLGLEEK